MKISYDVILKIKKHFNNKKFESNFGVKHHQHRMTQIYDSVICTSKKASLQDRIYVVAKQIEFSGNPVESHTYLVCQYDLNGDFVGECSEIAGEPYFEEKLNYIIKI